EVRRAASFLPRLVPLAEDLEADAVADDDQPLGAVESGPVLVPFLHVGGPVPLLEDKLSLAARLAVAGPFEDAVLGVRELLIVVEEELASQAGGGAGLRGDAEAPA